MTLEKRIDILQIQINTSKHLLTMYKDPKGLKKDIEYDEEILGFLLELKERREAENEV